MRCLLISIKPVYCRSIFDGVKRFEVRKTCPNLEDGAFALIYESAPTSKLTGWMRLGRSAFGAPEDLVRLVDDRDPHKAFYEPYLGSGQKPGLLPILHAARYDEPIPLQVLHPDVSRPPQSYQFVTITPHLDQRLFGRQAQAN